jgi:hypothetical protein
VTVRPRVSVLISRRSRRYFNGSIQGQMCRNKQYFTLKATGTSWRSLISVARDHLHDSTAGRGPSAQHCWSHQQSAFLLGQLGCGSHCGLSLNINIKIKL